MTTGTLLLPCIFINRCALRIRVHPGTQKIRICQVSNGWVPQKTRTRLIGNLKLLPIGPEKMKDPYFWVNLEPTIKEIWIHVPVIHHVSHVQQKNMALAGHTGSLTVILSYITLTTKPGYTLY